MVSKGNTWKHIHGDTKGAFLGAKHWAEAHSSRLPEMSPGNVPQPLARGTRWTDCTGSLACQEEQSSQQKASWMQRTWSYLVPAPAR